MIYVGYLCIGKSSISGRDGFIDLEFSLFNDGSKDWAKKYVAVANDLSDQGYYVFVSYHKEVREELRKLGCPFLCIFPDYLLEDVWYDRMAKRFKKNPSDKNLRALQRCATSFKQDIADLKTEDSIAVITDPEYNDLVRFLCNCKVENRFGILTDDESMETVFSGRPSKTINDLWDEDTLDINE